MSNSFQCRNLKLSFQVKNCYTPTLLLDLDSELQTKHVSYIVRNFELGCVFTIYKHNLFQIHATGIRRKGQLDQIISFLDMRCSLINFKIDNSLFSCKRSKNIDLSETLGRVLTSFTDYIPSFSEHIFPALFLKHRNKKAGNPTIILYHNSSYVILGGNCRNKIKKANCFINKLNKHWKRNWHVCIFFSNCDAGSRDGRILEQSEPTRGEPGSPDPRPLLLLHCPSFTVLLLLSPITVLILTS